MPIFNAMEVSAAGGANNFVSRLIPVVNVTASALTLNGAYALDLARTDTDVDTLDKAVSSVIVPLTANILAGVIGVVTSAIPAAGQGFLQVSGVCDLTVDASGAAIVKGNPLKCTNNATAAVLGTTGVRYHFIALEALASGTGTIKALIVGSGFGSNYP